jgi:hypothetical protein
MPQPAGARSLQPDRHASRPALPLTALAAALLFPASPLARQADGPLARTSARPPAGLVDCPDRPWAPGCESARQLWVDFEGLGITVRLLLSEVGPERLVESVFGLNEAIGILFTVTNRLDALLATPQRIEGAPFFPGCGPGGDFRTCADPEQVRDDDPPLRSTHGPALGRRGRGQPPHGPHRVLGPSRLARAARRLRAAGHALDRRQDRERRPALGGVAPLTPEGP